MGTDCCYRSGSHSWPYFQPFILRKVSARADAAAYTRADTSLVGPRFDKNFPILR